MTQRSIKQSFALAVAAVILFILGFGSAYAWQLSTIKNLQAENTTIRSQVTSLQNQLGTSAQQPVQSSANQSTSPDLIAGNVDMNRSDGQIQISAVYKYSLNPTELWVEYGASPSDINKSTQKITRGLGAGTSGTTYATGFVTTIAASDVQPGTGYYYRTAATIDGATVRSAPAFFTAAK